MLQSLLPASKNVAGYLKTRTPRTQKEGPYTTQTTPHELACQLVVTIRKYSEMHGEGEGVVPPKFYGLSKIQNVNVLLGFIFSYLAKHLISLLQLQLGKISSYADFVYKIQDNDIGPDDILVSLYIVLLFTKTSLKECLDLEISRPISANFLRFVRLEAIPCGKGASTSKWTE